MGDLIFKPASGGDLILQNDDAGAKIQLNNDDTIDITGSIDTGTFKGTIDSTATFPADHIIKTTFVLRTGGTLDVSDNTITTASSTSYTCDNSSNKLVLMGLGGIFRGSADGMGAMFYYLDGDLLNHCDNRDFKDSDEMPILNCTLDGYAGAKTIYFKIQSLSNDAKVSCVDGNGFVILEFQQ